MQCQVNDMIINNTPKTLTADPTDHTHALTIKDPDNPAQTVILPLALQNVTSLLNVRAPTLDKWNSDTIWRLHLTSKSLTWNLTLALYEDQEAAMTDSSGRVVMGTHALRGYVSVTNDNNFYSVLASYVQISSIETSLNGHICLRKTATIDPQTLDAHWMISPERAKRTVVMTKQ